MFTLKGDEVVISYGLTVTKNYQSRRADFQFRRPKDMSNEDAILICRTAVRAMLGLKYTQRGAKLYYEHFNEEPPGR